VSIDTAVCPVLGVLRHPQMRSTQCLQLPATPRLPVLTAAELHALDPSSTWKAESASASSMKVR